jgi:predicted permease
MYGLIDRALLSPPPLVVQPEQVMSLGFAVPAARHNDAGAGWMATTSYGAFETIRQQCPAFTDVAAWRAVEAAAVVEGTQTSIDATLVSGSYFRLLGTHPRHGRILEPADDSSSLGSAPAVLSHPFWTRAFGADPRAIGSTIVVSGIEYTIVGIMPRGFSGHSTSNVDIWLPFRAAMQNSPGWDSDRFRNFVRILARVSPADTPAAAAQAGSAIERRVALLPVTGTEVSAAERTIAYWLTAISVLVLVVGLANAVTLLLVRAAGRRRDLAVHIALGATRERLTRDLLAEAALIALLALAAACPLAYWFDELVRARLLPSVVGRGGFSVRFVGIAAAAGFLGFAAAAVAALVQIPREVRAGLSGAAHAGWQTRRAWLRSSRTLLVVQSSVSVVLLAGAALFARSLFHLVSQDFGMHMDDVLLVQFDESPGPQEWRHELFASALDRVRALPDVDRATPIQNVPFTGFHVPPISVPGRSGPPNIEGQLPFLIPATHELFEILGIRLVEGRPFVEADDRGAPVVIVNETMARNVWPGERAVGKCIRIGFEPSFDPFAGAGPPPTPSTVPCREVVGVARDVRQRSVVPIGGEEHLMQYFVPFSQVPPPPAAIDPGWRVRIRGLLVRTDANPDTITPAIRRIIVDGRSDLPFLQVRRYSDLLERQIRPWRLGTMLLTLFGALALAVSSIGLYAAFSHSVGARQHEIAVRLAVGATGWGVLGMVLREAATLAILGAAIGGVVAVIGAGFLESLLYGTSRTDPLALGASAVLMLIVTLAATCAPALRASRTDPSALLRSE